MGNICDHKGSTHPQVVKRVETREEAVLFFKLYLKEQMVLRENPYLCNAINSLIIKNLKGEDIQLACYCSPLQCHAEVIKEFVESQKYCINWFSNMVKCTPFKYGDLEFDTVENFYQAMKSEEQAIRYKISRMNPYKAKTYWKDKEVRKGWKNIQHDVMEYGIDKKFAANTKWGKILRGYRGDIIEWNNWGDKFWGKCIFTGEGENFLGRLMAKKKMDLMAN